MAPIKNETVMTDTQPYTVMTVCTGNICRSPMGEIILRHFFNERGLGDQVDVESSGVSDEEWSHPIDPWYGGQHEFEVAIDQIEEVAPYIVDWVAQQL